MVKHGFLDKNFHLSFAEIISETDIGHGLNHSDGAIHICVFFQR